MVQSIRQGADRRRRSGSPPLSPFLDVEEEQQAIGRLHPLDVVNRPVLPDGDREHVVVADANLAKAADDQDVVPSRYSQELRLNSTVLVGPLKALPRLLLGLRGEGWDGEEGGQNQSRPNESHERMLARTVTDAGMTSRSTTGPKDAPAPMESVGLALGDVATPNGPPSCDAEKSVVAG